MKPSIPPHAAALDRVVTILGGTKLAMARALGLKNYQTIQSWYENRVPAEYCPQIERLTNGEVRCEDLNDEVDWAYLRIQRARSVA
jgi:DNA-binding transcriptional regulator YdaS (Cro superfamily)